MIRFAEITNKNIADVLSLTVHDDQREYVAGNAVSLAEAYATRNEGNVALPYAIYNNELLIGFVMIGYGTVGDAEEPLIFKDSYILWRLMLDKKFQGKGYVIDVLNAVVDLVKKEPCGKYNYLLVSYEKENERGRKIYLKYGFKETNVLCGDEIVAILEK